jgi:ATP synthase protein I
MIRRALIPGALAVPVSFAIGAAVGGPDAGVSAAIGVVVVLANFAAHGWSLAWASRISMTLVQAVALGGFVVRMGVLLGLMFALNALDWFSPVAFGATVVPGTIGLLVFETRLAMRGLGGSLQIPADAAAVRAGERVASREA